MMAEKTRRLLDGLSLREPAQDGVIRRVESQLGVPLPADYVEFLVRPNGGEGPIGESGYLTLWPAEELSQLNKDYCVQEFAPGLTLMGSDGGGNAYAIDTREGAPHFVSVPFIGMDLDTVSKCGDGTFGGFIASVTATEQA